MSTGGQAGAIKFIVDIQNEEKIDQLTKDINVQEAAVKRLAAQLRQGAISEQQFITATKPMGEAIANATKELHALQGASALTGRGLMQLGYAVDDIQYGFNAIVNNIPQIVMGLGAGAGIAGAVGIAAVAINQLIKHWGELSDIAQSAWSGGSIEQLHRIRDAAEEAAKAFDKLTKQHTKQEEATEKFTTEAVVEGGIGKILSGLAGGIAMDPAMRAQLTDQEAKDRQDKIAMANRLANPADRMNQLAAIEKNYGGKLNAANLAKAVQMITQLDEIGPAGDLARRNAHRFATANPGAFPEGFAAKMNPEAAEADRVKKANIEADIQGNKNIRAAEKAAEHEKIEANKRLTEQGIHFEEQGKREQLEAEKKATMEAIRRGEHVLTPAARHQLQDMILGGKAPQPSQLLTTKAFVDKTLTSGMNAVPQKQLDELKGMHDNLKSIDKKIADLGRLG